MRSRTKASSLLAAGATRARKGARKRLTPEKTAEKRKARTFGAEHPSGGAALHLDFRAGSHSSRMGGEQGLRLSGSPSARAMGRRASLARGKHARARAFAARFVERALRAAGTSLSDCRAVSHLLQRGRSLDAARAALRALPPMTRALTLFLAALALTRFLSGFLAAAAFGALLSASSPSPPPSSSSPQQNTARSTGSAIIDALPDFIQRQLGYQPELEPSEPKEQPHTALNPVALSERGSRSGEEEDDQLEGTSPWTEAFSRVRGMRGPGFGYVDSNHWEGALGAVASFRAGYTEGRAYQPKDEPKPLTLTADGSSFVPTTESFPAASAPTPTPHQHSSDL